MANKVGLNQLVQRLTVNDKGVTLDTIKRRLRYLLRWGLGFILAGSVILAAIIVFHASPEIAFLVLLDLAVVFVFIGLAILGFRGGLQMVERAIRK